jgi:hypothetical protein
MIENRNLRIDGVKKIHDFCRILKHEQIYEHQVFISIKELLDRSPPFDLMKGTILYRARKVKPYEEIQTHECDPISFMGFGRKDSFVPPKEKILRGRANFKGISSLYVSTSMNTAIAETRPYKGNRIGGAKIKTNKRIKLFDLCLPPDHIGSYFLYDHPFDDVSPNTFDDLEANYYNLKDKIACMFATPYEFTENDKYLPTQYITEYIKNSRRFDGIRYTSSLSSDGENIVIFDCKNEEDCQSKEEAYAICEPISSSLYDVENTGYFARCWSSYDDVVACPAWAWKK